MSYFNRAVLATILISVLLVVLESENALYQQAPRIFDGLAMFVGILFLLEYLLRLYAAKADPAYSGEWGRLRYAVSFWAIVDLIAVIPLFLNFAETTPFLIRILRVIRILRIARLGRYSRAVTAVLDALHSRRHELVVTSSFAAVVLLLSSAGLYLAESDQQPEKFGSIPRALWWSVATLTTVGYGDVTPETAFGKVFAGITALAGVGLIAMPTGILAAAFSDAFQKQKLNED